MTPERDDSHEEWTDGPISYLPEPVNVKPDCTYAYTQLAENPMRVLQIKGLRKAHDSRSRIVVADMQVIGIDVEKAESQAEYAALSYVWNGGKANGAQDYLQVNETFTEITTNLADALVRFALEGNPQVVWADAVCIDQRDPKEKGQQIHMMKTVFAAATKVIAWLGKPTYKNEHTAVKSMWDLVTRCAADPDKYFRAEDVAELAKWNQMAICCMEDSLWFSRVWTLQECVVGNNVTLQYGEAKLSVEAFWLVHPKETCAFKGPSSIQELFSIMDKYRDSSYLELYELLTRTLDREATLPKDKVLGLLGLHTGPKLIESDYT